MRSPLLHRPGDGRNLERVRGRGTRTRIPRGGGEVMARRVVFLLVLRFLAAPVLASAQGLQITHEAAGCVLAEHFPAFAARVEPADGVAAVRVVFRPKGATHWYSVRMKRDGGGFSALLPKPKKSLESFTYYLEATDHTLATARTEEFNPVVAEGAGGCQGKVVARAFGTGKVTLEAVSGAPRVPLGFSANGVVTATAAGVAAVGTTAAVTGGAAAGGGGISTGLLVAGGVVAAGGVAAVVVASGAQNDGDGGEPPPLVRVRAQVFAVFVNNPNGGAGTYANPVAGALVNPGSRCTAFTLTIVASGFPTYSLAQNWVSPPTGPVDKIISLVPPMPNASSLSPCAP